MGKLPDGDKYWSTTSESEVSSSIELCGEDGKNQSG